MNRKHKCKFCGCEDAYFKANDGIRISACPECQSEYPDPKE